MSYQGVESSSATSQVVEVENTVSVAVQQSSLGVGGIVRSNGNGIASSATANGDRAHELNVQSLLVQLDQGNQRGGNLSQCITQCFASIKMDYESGILTREQALEQLQCMIVYIFQSRDREGKGEKTTSYRMMLHKLWKVFFSIEGLNQLVVFGCWKDLFQLIILVNDYLTVDQARECITNILTLICREIKSAVEEKRSSLLFKWLPREQKELFNDVSEVLTELGFKKLSTSVLAGLDASVISQLASGSKRWRSLIQLGMSFYKACPLESAFCQHTLVEFIEGGHISSVASKSIKNLTKALLLAPVSRKPKDERKGPAPARPDHILRDEDRRQAKRLFEDLMEDKDVKLKGSQNDFCRLIEAVWDNETSVAESEAAQKQYESFYESVKKKIMDAIIEFEQKRGIEMTVEQVRTRLGEILRTISTMTDVSGSMQDPGMVPMFVSIGFAILISDLKKEFCPSVSGHTITFDSIPAWVFLSDKRSLFVKVQHLKRAPWGASTNIDRAVDLLLVETGRDFTRFPRCMIITSDMQFDEAGCGSPSTAYQRIIAKIRAHFQIPPSMLDADIFTIVFWNLAVSDSTPVDSKTKGVIQVSGGSPKILDTVILGLMNGSLSNGVEIDPVSILIEALSIDRYNPIRALCQTETAQRAMCEFLSIERASAAASSG
jgi:hypothetical protein